MKVTYKYNNNKFNFELQYPKSLAFEAAMTTYDNVSLYNKLSEESCSTAVYEFPITAVRTVSKILTTLGIEIETAELMEKIGKPVFEDLGQEYLRDQQFLFIKKIMKYWSGSVTLETGFGKGTMIVYLVQASLIRNSNIVICANTYSVLDELNMRLARYNTSCSIDFNRDERVWLINPLGFMARNNRNDFKDWFEKVDMLIVDECDAVTPSLQQFIEEFIPNCRIFYGMSATPDKKTGRRFDNITSLNNFEVTAARILYYFGPAIVYRPPSKKIRLVVTPFNSGNYKNLWSYDKCVMHVTHSRNFPSYVKKCIQDNNKNGRSCILLPFTNREQVYYLLGNKLLQQYHIVMWTASGIVHNNGLVEGGAGLDRIKELVNNHEVDLLMTSQVGFKGIDLVELKSVLFMTGSSYGVVTQILGRIFRYAGSDLPTVYFLENISENPLYNKAQRMRYEYITMHEHVTEKMYLPYIEGWNFSP